MDTEPEKTRIVISLIIVFGFFAVIAAYVLLPIKGDQAQLNLLVGALITMTVSVVQYFVGTTSGSKAKDATIASMVAANSNTPQPPAQAQNVAPITRTGT